MKITVISYSLTGNNQALASSLATELSAKLIKITEFKTRTTTTIMLDVLFDRTPQVSPKADALGKNDLVVFVGPVWMGHVATPLRAYLNYIKAKPSPYAFVSISGGSDGANPKLAGELKKRTGQTPVALIDLHVADLLSAGPKRDRDSISAYRLTNGDVKQFTDTILGDLWKVVEKPAVVNV
ncbi:flavodoxin family protein [Mucilaginibacter paludis]|uniref:NADPH-dependent FMN reductase-like domain-containing protein n=1 Tax=Mucilaginibacter paludis DSM 18603 TaxID=714943 RepID=H1YCM1_9SPHI|nr:flavodoxin family protein [Mucilaginibacter paludis]EHQ24208.1 hypothetical protein Mucpa_0004 [Mucilaginibacter paludis DSM 18603]